MGFNGSGLGVSLCVDGGRLGVVDRWLGWFVGFGRWVLILILRLMGLDFDYNFLG